MGKFSKPGLKRMVNLPLGRCKLFSKVKELLKSSKIPMKDVFKQTACSVCQGQAGLFSGFTWLLSEK